MTPLDHGDYIYTLPDYLVPHYFTLLEFISLICMFTFLPSHLLIYTEIPIAMQLLENQEIREVNNPLLPTHKHPDNNNLPYYFITNPNHYRYPHHLTTPPTHPSLHHDYPDAPYPDPSVGGRVFL